jgi:hypothetical protein
VQVTARSRFKHPEQFCPGVIGQAQHERFVRPHGMHNGPPHRPLEHFGDRLKSMVSADEVGGLRPGLRMSGVRLLVRVLPGS